MEILHKFKQNGYYTADLYHLLAKKKLLDESTDILPSEYQKEMQMSTHERLQNLNNFEIDNIVRIGNKPAKPAVLHFTPKVLVFQNFKPNDKLTAKFSVKNISKAPTFLNMVFKESSHFSIKPCGGPLLSRLAPGISVSFCITFLPIQYEDYIHRIIFYTDIDEYNLPIIAMGPRPIFNFPDKVEIPKAPLKVQSESLIMIRNIGVVPSACTLITRCPFSVEPKSISLNPKEHADVKIKCKTMYMGEVQGTLYAVFETGENFRISLVGTAHTVSVELEKQVVRFFDTYNTMMRQQVFKIVNKSDHLLTYMCMKNDCVSKDFEEKLKLATIFYKVKESESTKAKKLVHYDVLSSDEHERVYTRIFYDELHSLVADETLLFQNMHFSITPPKGHLWPNKPTELTITFSPKEIGEFNSTAYLDIDGVFDRVPLNLVGISIPPLIQLNIETLNMDCVYISKPYNYEVVAINKGHINGVIVYKDVPALFGSVISCSPEMHCLKPGDKEIFVISFCNSNQGPFFEEINFVIRDTDVVLKLYLKGEVVYPTVNFSVPCLDFGTISVGVPNTLEVEVINESVVSISGSVKISSDGPEISSITLEDYAVAEYPKPKIPQWPREFNVAPCKVDIEPESRIKIKVTLIANLVRANQTSLDLELEKSDSPPITLPVIYNALVPEITVAPDIKMRACFLDYSYKTEVAVTSNEFTGYFTLEEPEEVGSMQIYTPLKEGYIKPNSTLCIPITIVTSVLGLHEYSMRLNLFGSRHPIEICHISGCGVRPIVTCTPMALHWGQVKLLTTSQKCLTICNDSPVLVSYRASLLNKDGRFQITPAEGHVEPESEIELLITLYLVDANTYSNKAVIHFENVKDILVPLSATGVGTSIIIGELRDRVDLGRHFTRIPLNCKVVMENRGTRLHALEWSEHYKAPKTKVAPAAFFELDPKNFKIGAGEQLEVLITGISNKVTTVKETWYLVGSVEGINKKELLLSCPIVAEFVDPKIELSTTVMNFRYDYGPYSEHYKLTDILTIKNVSKLPLDLDINTKPPFAIIQRHDTYIVPPEEEDLCCCIRYRESDIDLQRLLKSLGPHQSRIFIDYLTSKQIEPLRKGSLDFFRDINKMKLAFNFTHVVEQRLEDRDVMKVQLIFDTTKHPSLKSKVFSDIIKIKYRGHKNKDAIKVIGQINYPNMLVLTPRVDFQCILNESVESRTIKIQNATPLLVCYKFQWKKCSITEIAYESIESGNIKMPEIMNNGIRDFLTTAFNGSEQCNPIEDERINNEINLTNDFNSPALTRQTNSEFDFEKILPKKLMMKKIAPMIDVDCDLQFEWVNKFSRPKKVDRYDLNSMVRLVPHRGLLRPGELQFVNIIFQPRPNLNVKATLECEVLGGPPETILVTGKSSDLRYKVNSHRINFKIRSFHENAVEVLLITNVAQLPFEYKTYLTPIKHKNELEGHILELLPPEKVLEPDEVAELQIIMQPGILGYFRRVFLLEIGHLPHIPIEVFGWGIIPQVYFTLKRVDKLAPEVGYRAIQELTMPYLEAVSDIFAKYNAEHMNSPLTDYCFEDPDLQHDWHVCSPWDGFPSSIDVELAIERLLVMDYVKERPELLAINMNSAKSGPIPGFQTQPYVINYGVVITGCTVQCIAEIINYSPTITRLHFAKGTRIPDWLNVKLCGKLNPGETGRLEVVFSPTSEEFTELEQQVETTFNLEVPNGVSIPIIVKSLCAVPYLVSNVKTIDFGAVRCGDKIVCSIPLKNVGKPTCIWFVTLRLKAHGPSPMVVTDNSGKYEPGEGGWLSVSFKPTMEMVYEGLLIFRCHMNPNRMTIPVIGQGIVPHVHIIGPNINFPPTLPWARTTYFYFGITNPCPFPIELIIAHSDLKWKEEEDIYQLLYKYYNKPEEMLVPTIKPHVGFPQEIIDFYTRFTMNVKKIKESEELLSAKASAMAKSTTAAASKKPAKPAKGAKTPVTAGKDHVRSPIKFRTEAEIISDAMKMLKDEGVDPLKECRKIYEEEDLDSDDDKNLKGFLLFVHGSPCEGMQCQEIAYYVGKQLKLPVVNVDHSVVKALLSTGESSAKEAITLAINDTYEALSRSKDPGDEEEEDEFASIQDEFEILLNKITTIGNSKTLGTPRSKASDKKKKRSSTSVPSCAAVSAMGSTTMFRMDLTEELLTSYFQLPMFNRGFVVDSLTSIIFKNPSLVLTTMLKCKNNIWNAHLILCQSDFAKWSRAYEEAHREVDTSNIAVPKVYDEAEINDIVRSFEEMNEEEYENAPAELKSVYITYGLEQRREKYLENLATTYVGSTVPASFGGTSSKDNKDKGGKGAVSRSSVQVDATDAKKKTKKDEVGKGKGSNEYTTMSVKYNEYMKNTFESLVSIASNWIFEECDVGYPLYAMNGQLASSSVKKLKKKSEVQLTLPEVNPEADRGFPLTLIMCPCQYYKNAVLNLLRNSPIVMRSLAENRKVDILKFPVNRKEYTVLLPKTFPTINHEKPLNWKYLDEVPIQKCECQMLTDLDLMDDSTQDNVMNILSKWHCICGKKMTSSQTSTSDLPSTIEKMVGEDSVTESYPLPLYSVKSFLAPEARLILNPGDLVRCKYAFNPQEEGNFSVKRFVEVSGWPDSRADINVKGICDLPRLDSRPKKMFENFVRRTIEEHVYKITYLDDQKIFQFGPIFIGHQRIYEERYTIDLRNSSLITADVVIEFLEDTSVFTFDKNFIRLEAGARDKLTISAAPTEVGVHTATLLFCVKDNPAIVVVNIGCDGVSPIVEILPLTKTIGVAHVGSILGGIGNNDLSITTLPTTLFECLGRARVYEMLRDEHENSTMIYNDYKKLLLYRREEDRFIVKNDSILPVMWKIRNPKDFAEDFIISHITGIVPSYENQVVPVTYIACQVGVINNRILAIDIYDAEGRGEPMLTESLYLSAECYDVMVECAHENPAENYLNYGNVKVNSTVSRDMYLLNRGKYNIYYKLKKVKKFPEPSLLKSFEAIPESGMIPATVKLVSIEFQCTPTTSMNLHNVPAYICSLLDSSKEQVIVAKFPVCVSIASFYNTFTLFPLGELNFHIIPVGTAISREVILNNTSKCPVTYEIILPPKYQIDLDAASSAPKTKDNKIKVPPLRCGNFMILNEDNLLAPGTSRTIQIQFFATAPQTFNETINFVISDTCPAEAQGVPLRLVGTGAMPTLDIWNIETTFREHLIVKNLSEYKVPESSPHCVFAENSVTLHFFCVTIKTRFVGTIDLYNNGLVACALTMKLHYQANSNPDIFSLDKYDAHIEPLMHKNLGIIFTPKALKEYRAVLEIKLKLLDNQEQSFKICLIGEGVIPRIQILSPRLRTQNTTVLFLPVTCLGSVSQKSIRFKNISSVKSVVVVKVLKAARGSRTIFWLTADPKCAHMILSHNKGPATNVGNDEELNVTLKMVLNPKDVAIVNINYNPIKKGLDECDVKLKIVENPYEFFIVSCEGEAFMEDVILTDLEMLSMDTDLEVYKLEGMTNSEAVDSTRKRSKSLVGDPKKSAKSDEGKKMLRKASGATMSGSSSLLKYVLNFGGCELCSLQRNSVVMVNNSEKVYKFTWSQVECLVIKPSMGYISPGEDKDIEIMFYSPHPIEITREFLFCKLVAVNDDSLTLDMRGATWDNRQIVTTFEHDKDISLNQRHEKVFEEQTIPVSHSSAVLGTISMVIVYSASTEYTKYKCTLPEEKVIDDTFIYQSNSFDFTVRNIGNVPLKIVWSFVIEEEYPSRLNKKTMEAQQNEDLYNSASLGDSYNSVLDQQNQNDNELSQVTLFSGSMDRTSVDTWFEIDLPFSIEPNKGCLQPGEKQLFKVTFAPLDAFEFKLKLKSTIDNLNPYDQNISCKLTAKSLIPYVHLDIEESDYLTSGRTKATMVLPEHMTILEFNVLGSGCYKKTFNVINPTSEPYEFIFEMIMSDKPELIPVHCNMLKGYAEGGTSSEVTFTFSPTAPGVYESQWKFLIPAHNLVMHLLVVGLVREPDVVFVPTILIIRNSLVGFTTAHDVVLKNNENEALDFVFKGNSLANESGKTPVIVEPNEGTLKPNTETPIKIIFTPIDDGPQSFKIFCSITYLMKYLTLCVNSLSYSIRPKVTYYLIGNEHVLNSDVNTNIYLDQTASTYERKIPFFIRNNGSATFFFDWQYNTSFVKKFLQVYVEPKSGHVTPGNEVECTLFFTLKQIPVQAFPVKLLISDGPEYIMFLYAEIEKPIYNFSCMDIDFGKCFINTPDATYKKIIGFTNGDKAPVLLDLNFTSLPELYVDYKQVPKIDPGKRQKITIFFRPKQVKEYEFKLQFWVNSLCEEIVTIKGEGIPLLFDLYEGCQKSFDLGHVKVGEKIIRTIEVMNHSIMPIDASYIFRDMYPVVGDTTDSDMTSVCLNPSVTKIPGKPDAGPNRVQMLQNYKDDKIRNQIAKDIENALSSLRVVPNKCTILPYRKVPLKIQFKPVGMISTLNVQLNMKVFEFERPLVRLSGCATGMSLRFSQTSLQFGRVRKRGCKILKVMLHNEGNFGARFWWQPLKSNEFTISPQQGTAAAQTDVTFTITYRPRNHNPFVKVWACCNIENYMPLELALYATCVDVGNVLTKTMFLECPVREVKTDYVAVTNPTDDLWLVLSEVSGGPFDTLKEFNIEPNSTFNIPVNFRPKSIGQHECQLLYSPLAESALFVSVTGVALHPNPNGTIQYTVAAKDLHTEELPVHNITEDPESYIVFTEMSKVTPEKFEGYYEIKHPETIKTWGEASATCRWTFVCYEECEMRFKVMFINEVSREYQFYNIIATVTSSPIVATLTFESRARESLQKELVVKNPLSTASEFHVKSMQLQCPDMLTINRKSEAVLTMTYSPLVVGETEEYLEVRNELVGTYVYRVILKCLPAKEKTLDFETSIGSTIPIRLRVQNKTDMRTEFLCEVSHPSIQCEPSYALGPLEKGKFLVWFEPTELGLQKSRISFNSPVAGEFIFNINGTGKRPTPEGPLEIQAGGFVNILFKNVFTQNRSFKFYVDTPEFYVQIEPDMIKPKKEVKIPVFLTENPGWSKMPTGMLTIQTFDPPTPDVRWTYFLQGI